MLRVPPKFLELHSGHKPEEPIDAHSVQPYYTLLLAREAKMTISIHATAEEIVLSAGLICPRCRVTAALEQFQEKIRSGAGGHAAAPTLIRPRTASAALARQGEKPPPAPGAKTQALSRMSSGSRST